MFLYYKIKYVWPKKTFDFLLALFVALLMLYLPCATHDHFYLEETRFFNIFVYFKIAFFENSKFCCVFISPHRPVIFRFSIARHFFFDFPPKCRFVDFTKKSTKCYVFPQGKQLLRASNNILSGEMTFALKFSGEFLSGM